MLKTNTMLSVKGNASHTPVIPARTDNKNATGIIRAKPLAIEMNCAGKARSVEVKKRDSTILIPAKGIAVKYSFRPGTAICCSKEFFSLLKI